jgi:hypothetical protein
MFPHRRQLRQWAARVLLAWLFGIVAGVANACVVSADRDEHGEHARTHHAAQAVHHHEEGPGKANCLDFCGKSAVVVPGSKVKVADEVAADLAPLPARVSAAPSLATGTSARAAIPHPAPPGGPPIPIVFLRLAL